MEDLTGVGKAVEKLVEVISRGCGALYRPRAIRNEAKARAEEVRLVGAANNEVEVEKARMLAKVEAERRILLADADEEILERARARLVHREVQRQRNLEAITEKAFEQLPTDVSRGPVDDDWVRRFFSYAEDVSEEQMQLLWARILAGEVSKPGSFSLRTLNVVCDLTSGEAEYFRVACCLAFDDGFLLQAPPDGDSLDRIYWLASFGLPYQGLLSLQDARLIHDLEARAPYKGVFSNSNAGVSLTIPYYEQKICLKRRAPSDSFELTAIPFTEAGRQLRSLVTREEIPGFIDYIAQRLNCEIVDDPDAATFRFSVPPEARSGSPAGS